MNEFELLTFQTKRHFLLKLREVGTGLRSPELPYLTLAMQIKVIPPFLSLAKSPLSTLVSLHSLVCTSGNLVTEQPLISAV